jgi:hypothetical protein
MSNLELYEKIKEDLKAYLLKVFATYVVIVLAYTVIPATTDSTDSGIFSRSGVSLRIDYGTGCHYLEGAGGGLTPRVDKEGNHICTGEEQ